MSIDFTTLQALEIPEGVVTQIEDASGRVIWMVQSNESIILEVEKITSNTYAGETTYTDEQFILLDIYPKKNGTVNVTYGGLTKTITDTSGAEEPNAQRVFFGTFNGVSDNVATPASGTLTIEGDVRGVTANASFNTANKQYGYYRDVTAIKSLGDIEVIPLSAFAGCKKISSVVIPSSVKTISVFAFSGCTALSSVQIKNGIETIEAASFLNTALSNLRIPASVTTLQALSYGSNKNCYVEIDTGNTSYKIDGNGIVEIATNVLVEGFLDTVIPSYITTIGSEAFSYLTGLTTITIPSSVTEIGSYAFRQCTGLTNIILLSATPPNLPSLITVFENTTCTFTVPKGCGEVYKVADGWSNYADRIVEASE